MDTNNEMRTDKYICKSCIFLCSRLVKKKPIVHTLYYYVFFNFEFLFCVGRCARISILFSFG